MKKLKAVAAVISAAMVMGSFSGCYFFPAEEELLEAPTIKVEDVTYSTYTAKKKTISSTTIVTGYLSSKTEKECYFTDYTGQLKNIYVRPGDMVEEGQLLAEMNTGTLEYELEIQRLRVQLAQLNYNSSGSAADRLQLEIEQNTLAEYQAEYDGSKIYAPISGQVSYVDGVNPGTEVNPYRVLVRIVDPDDLYVLATVTESKAYTLGDKVTVTIGDDSYDAEITRTPKEEKAEGDEVTNTIHADFTGSSKPTFAFLGSLSDVTKVNSVSENAIVIPKHLVKTDDTHSYVQILVDGEKQEVTVTTGISNATEIEITSGLNEGDQVVVK